MMRYVATCPQTDKGDIAMDITAILSSVKGKVLDVHHFDLLKHAYELQNENIEQLKTNNEALKEKLQLLKEEAALLSRENETLTATVKTLRSQLAALSHTEGLCEDETKILRHLASCRHEPTAEMIAASLRLDITRTEYYLHRMWRKYVYSHDWTNDRPSEWFLIQDGRAYLVENKLI